MSSRGPSCKARLLPTSEDDPPPLGFTPFAYLPSSPQPTFPLVFSNGFAMFFHREVECPEHVFEAELELADSSWTAFGMTMLSTSM